MSKIGKLVGRIGFVVGCSGTALGTVLLGSSQAAEGERLMPSPDTYCVQHAPFSHQVLELDWVVIYDGVSGTAGRNDWGCDYVIQASIPVGSEAYTLPPFTRTFGIDWAAMCSEQYEGSTLEWAVTPGPVVTGRGPYGAPWMCEGEPGARYDQSVTVNGPVGRVD